MSDLIDRDAVLHDVSTECSNAHEAKYYEAQVALTRAKKIIRDAPTVNRWISVEDALPEKDGEYLVFTEYEDVFKCTFDSNEENKWGFEQDYHDPDTLGWAGTTWTAVETVTHWMPLPEPPEKE